MNKSKPCKAADKNEVMEYFAEQYQKTNFRLMPGHWPDFHTKEEVDKWISSMECIGEIVFEKK
jgi:hypothetical protein